MKKFDEDEFLRHIRHGYTVIEACQLMGVHRQAAYYHRRVRPKFAERWRNCKKIAYLKARSPL